MNSFLTIDLENWYDRDLFFNQIIQDQKNLLHKKVRKILNIFKKYDGKTTFFILGKMVQQDPDMILEIFHNGHEIALHGYDHYSLNGVSQDVFENDLKKSIFLIKDLIGIKPIGFRAPNFSIAENNDWIFKTLKKFGFIYDSSLFPFQTPSYGSFKIPRYPYHADIENPYRVDFSSSFIEYPILTSKFLNLPFSGGFYLRLFGVKLLLRAIKDYNRSGYPAMCYFHPWELFGFPSQPISFIKSRYACYRIPCYDLLIKLLKNVDSISIKSYLYNN